MTDYPTREARIVAEEDANRRDALAAALKRDDEVYLVLDGRIRAFGHREDAEQYEAQRWGERGHVITERVLDHADARALIEQQGET